MEGLDVMMTRMNIPKEKFNKLYEYQKKYKVSSKKVCEEYINLKEMSEKNGFKIDEMWEYKISGNMDNFSIITFNQFFHI